MESRRLERMLSIEAKSAIKETITSDTFSGNGLRAIVRNQCKDILTPEALMNDTVLSGAVQIMMAQN